MHDTDYIPGLKLHPLSMLIRFIAGLPQLLFPILALSFGTRKAAGDGFFVYILLAVLLLTVAVQAISWMRFRYYIGDDDIRIESGILSRTARSIPYDRIQDVSIEEKLLARIFNLAEVKFDTGGGAKDNDEAKLSYVLESDAVALRETIRSRKMGLSHLQTHNISETFDTNETLFAMDNTRVLTFGFYSFSLVIFAVLGGLAQQFDFLLQFDLWDFDAWINAASDRGVSIDAFGTNARIVGAIIAILALIPIGIATGIITTLLREFGFQLDLTSKGFRRRRGLLSKTDVVMQVARVQAAILSTGPIRKLRGWYALQFVSMGNEGEDGGHHMAVPFAKLHEIDPIISITNIDPITHDVVFENSPIGPWIDTWIITSLLVLVTFAGLSVATNIVAYWLLALIPLIAPLFYFRWQREMHAISNDQIYSKHGWWREKVTIVRQTHVQSVTISQGPLSRLRGLAMVDFGIAGGTCTFTAIPMAKAQSIRNQVLCIAAPIDFSELENVIEKA